MAILTSDVKRRMPSVNGIYVNNACEADHGLAAALAAAVAFCSRSCAKSSLPSSISGFTSVTFASIASVFVASFAPGAPGYCFFLLLMQQLIPSAMPMHAHADTTNNTNRKPNASAHSSSHPSWLSLQVPQSTQSVPAAHLKFVRPGGRLSDNGRHTVLYADSPRDS